MELWEFGSIVAAQVRFTPDRKEIEAEIMAHLKDRRDAYLEQGLSGEEAKRQAVAAMGDPEEIGKALDRLHSPLLGWFQIWFSRVVCLAAVAAIIAGIPWVCTEVSSFRGWGKHYSLLGSFWEDHWAADVMFDQRPDAVWRYGSYTFTVERASLVREANAEELTLCYILKASTPDPWSRGPQQLHMWLYAEDDLGNHHPSYMERLEQGLQDYEHESCGNIVEDGTFASYYEMWVKGIDPDADELTICFDRYGEQAVLLTLPLKGGEVHGEA